MYLSRDWDALPRISKDDMKYQCLNCGRDKFDRPFQPHKCSGNYRKRSFLGEWAEKDGVCAICETRHDLIYIGRKVQGKDSAWIDYRCPITGGEFTADDSASMSEFRS